MTQGVTTFLGEYLDTGKVIFKCSCSPDETFSAVRGRDATLCCPRCDKPVICNAH